MLSRGDGPHRSFSLRRNIAIITKILILGGVLRRLVTLETKKIIMSWRYECNKNLNNDILQSDSSDLISINLTQIEKDVYRCDRNHSYFTKQQNLRKLSNIMSCFVWEHPEIGYVQVSLL